MIPVTPEVSTKLSKSRVTSSRHDYTYIQLAKGGHHCAEF